ncbi:MAG: bifunctional UDP-N-acetylglucosamine diphosphorylase/glucosamine-1-phosphate N-acetyltransferase GlmU [Acidobacteria bacterium]|nr:bifunctional UDP-N-acetylglucosamine diphosphorylase/glucosamine-1-phosphate N-acetyltransferase GlmU [Acidobacteriota bacterium]
MQTVSEKQKPLDVLILAAGLGTRMRTNQAKVLHRLDGRPLINHVSRTASALAPGKIYVVIGHQGDEVKRAVAEELREDKTQFVVQERQLGTGDAVNAARKQHHRSHRGRGAAGTILTVKLGDPTGYGRIIRDREGLFEKIVEQKDASETELQIKEINAGIYCFETGKLFDALARVKNDNAQQEYYLTDVPGLLRDEGEDIAIYNHHDAFEIEGVNNRLQLADLERLLRRRTVSRLMLDYGVTFIDPKSAYISEQASIGRDTVIHPNVTIEGNTAIGDGCEIRAGSRIANSTIGRSVRILDNCMIVDSEIRDSVVVGPMAHLRGGAIIEQNAKIGNFVEVKKSRVGRGSKASHLTYLGDATIGENTNIGAGTITCNYDGVRKNETHIGSNVNIGSDTMLVAPVKVGDGASTGAGSVVTKDVESNAIVVGVPARPMNVNDPKSVQAKRAVLTPEESGARTENFESRSDDFIASIKKGQD